MTAGFLSAALIFGTLSGADARSFDVYGAVRMTTADGIVHPVDSIRDDGFKKIQIVGPGGIHWSSDFLEISLESAGREGAELRLDGPKTKPAAMTLMCGTLDLMTDSPVEVHLADAAVTVRGHAVLTLVPDMESTIRIFSGEAVVRIGAERIVLSSLKALRLRKSKKSSPETLLPAPQMSAPPKVLFVPLELIVQPADEKLSAGAIQVECTTREHFWEGASRFLFGPAEPVVLTDLPEGIVYIRVRTISRAHLAGPPGPYFSTRVLKDPPQVFLPNPLQSEILQGQLIPPIPNAVIRWDMFRTVTNENGAFTFHPDNTMGITVADLRMEADGSVSFVLEPAILLSDPDHMAHLVIPQTDSRQASIFIRTTQITVRNTSSQMRIILDGIPMDSAETMITAPPHTSRVVKFERTGGDPPIRELAIYQDAEAPRILNVSLESRGATERFSVHADILDLGIGLRLPAKAVFENDAGERLDMNLYQISDLRLEGSASLTALQGSRGIRSSVWWVRVEAEDLLGNAARYEKTVFHKRHHKFVSVGLKDLIQIWKNKL